MQNEQSSKKITQLMQVAGFQELTSSIYVYLLTRESASLSDIISVLQETESAIQEAIKALMHTRLIAVDAVRNSYVFYALHPSVVWEAYKTELIWSFACTPDDFSCERCYSQDLPHQNKDALQYACNIIDSIKNTASELYTAQQSVKKHRWREALDGEQLTILLIEAISQAKLNIRAVSKPPRSPQVALVWETIVDRINNGVTYQRIANLTEVIEHGLHIIERDIQRHSIDLRIMELSQIEHKFYTIDSKFVVVYHSTGSEGNQLVGRVTNEANIIKRYRKRFESYYQMSIPAYLLVERLRERGQTLLCNARTMGFTQVELDWFECLINWGTFCELKHPEIANQQDLEKRALGMGLITYGSTNRPIPNYQINVHDIEPIMSNYR